MGVESESDENKIHPTHFYFHSSAEKAGGGCFSTVVDLVKGFSVDSEIFKHLFCYIIPFFYLCIKIKNNYLSYEI